MSNDPLRGYVQVPDPAIDYVMYDVDARARANLYHLVLLSFQFMLLAFAMIKAFPKSDYEYVALYKRGRRGFEKLLGRGRCSVIGV